jgi:hypothetical protein
MIESPHQMLVLDIPTSRILKDYCKQTGQKHDFNGAIQKLIHFARSESDVGL